MKYLFLLALTCPILLLSQAPAITASINLAQMTMTAEDAGFDDDYPLDIDINLEYIRAYSFGIEQIGKQGQITGITYTKRGTTIKFDEEEIANYYGYVMSMDIEGEQTTTMNYITAYALLPIFQSNGLGLFIGGETGWMIGELENEYSFSITQSFMGDTYSVDDSDSDTLDVSDFEDEGGQIIDYGALISARYNLNPKMAISATYYYGLNKLHEDNDEMFHRGIKLGISLGA